MSLKADMRKAEAMIFNLQRDLANEKKKSINQEARASNLIMILFNDILKCKVKADFVELQKVVKEMAIERAERYGLKLDDRGVILSVDT